jgi:NADH dehydrogenase
VERASIGLKELDEGLALRNHVLERMEEACWEPDPERRRRLLTFAVVGGGPTGVEYAGALQELIGLVLDKDFQRLDHGDIKVVLMEGEPHLLGTFAPDLRASAERALRRKGVEVWTGALVKTIEGDLVTLADGRSLEAGTVVWTAGVRAAPIGAALGPTARSGRVAVEPTLQLPGHPEVFVIGDLAYLEQDGEPLPMLIPVAMQQARHVAGAISDVVAGRRPKPFRYSDPGFMATIGRNAAVAQLGRIHLSGFLGWLTWLGVHLLNVVTFRSKVIVLVNWAWDYLFLDRPVRLIVSAARDPASTGPAAPAPAPPPRDGARPAPAPRPARRTEAAPPGRRRRPET